jgi:transcriptional regulator with XRE-family HTH domain
MMEQEFTVLENKTIGRNLYKYRKIREKKASEVADYIGISESAYTKYERGESQITIDVIQKASEILEVDPLYIVASTPGNFVDGSNSPHAIVVGGNIGGDAKLIDENQTALIAKLIESQIAMNEKIMTLLEKK